MDIPKKICNTYKGGRIEEEACMVLGGSGHEKQLYGIYLSLGLHFVVPTCYGAPRTFIPDDRQCVFRQDDRIVAGENRNGRIDPCKLYLAWFETET